MSNSKNEMANGVDKQVQHILPQDRPLYRTVTFPSPSSRFKFKSPTPKKKSFLGIFSYFLGTVVLATYAANAVVVYQKEQRIMDLMEERRILREKEKVLLNKPNTTKINEEP